MFQNLVYLTTNPAEYLEDESIKLGSLDKPVNTAKGFLADVYGGVTAIGVGLLAIGLAIAIICFGFLHDNQEVKDKKKWIVRIIIACIGLGTVLTVVGIATGVGQTIK